MPRLLGRQQGSNSCDACVFSFDFLSISDRPQLSNTLRRYLEIRFYLPAEEQTTAEFLDGMRRSPLLTDEQQLLLRDFLERCDLVKFARVVPPRQESLATAGMARKFINDTASQG